MPVTRLPLTTLPEVLRTLDLAALADRGRPGQFLGRLTKIRFGASAADALNVVTESGAFRGDRLEVWLHGILKEFGVTTFGDLVLDDPGGEEDERSRYRLVVMASDLTRKRLTRLPWDYSIYGLHADDQSVASAVRASAASPFVFRPVELPGPRGTATLVDGGLLSNYPIDGPLALGVAVIETAIEGNQAEHLLSLRNQARSIFVPSDGIVSFNFKLTETQRIELFENGYRAAQEFLSREALSY